MAAAAPLTLGHELLPIFGQASQLGRNLADPLNRTDILQKSQRLSRQISQDSLKDSSPGLPDIHCQTELRVLRCLCLILCRTRPFGNPFAGLLPLQISSQFVTVESTSKIRANFRGRRKSGLCRLKTSIVDRAGRYHR